MAERPRAAQRRQHARVRLARLRRLRQIGAPAWVIRNEQIALACNRRGLRPDGNRYAQALRERYLGIFLYSAMQPWED